VEEDGDLPESSRVRGFEGSRFEGTRLLRRDRAVQPNGNAGGNAPPKASLSGARYVAACHKRNGEVFLRRYCEWRIPSYYAVGSLDSRHIRPLA
jgi:hypothetical protein